MAIPSAVQKPTPLDLFLLVSTMAVWGLGFVAIKIVVPETGPYWLATYRTGLGAIMILPIAAYLGMHFPVSRDAWVKIAVVAFTMFVFPQVLISWSLQTLDAGISSLLLGTGPLMALIAGHFVSKDEPFTLQKLIGVLLGFFAICLIIGVEALQSIGSQSVFSQILLLAASASFVTGGFTIRKIDLPFLPLTALCLGLGVLMLVPVSLFMDGLPPLEITFAGWAWLAFLGVVATGLAFLVRFYLVQRIGYSMFSIGVNFIPVFGVILGAFILDERVHFTTILALIAVLAGLFIARSGAK